jgi:hypothetical protein
VPSCGTSLPPLCRFLSHNHMVHPALLSAVSVSLGNHRGSEDQGFPLSRGRRVARRAPVIAANQSGTIVKRNGRSVSLAEWERRSNHTKISTVAHTSTANATFKTLRTFQGMGKGYHLAETTASGRGHLTRACSGCGPLRCRVASALPFRAAGRSLKEFCDEF